MIKVEKRKSKNLRDIEESLFISFKFNPSYVAMIKSLPRRWYDPDTRTWEIPVSDLELLLTKFDRRDVFLDFPTEERISDVKSRLEGIKPDIDFKFKTKPYPHQIEAFNRGIKDRMLLLGDDMGLGKGKQAIDIMVARKQLHGLSGVLVICGVNAIKYVWEREVKLHSDEKCLVIDGSSAERLAKLTPEVIKRYFFSVINVEAIRKKEILERIIKLIDGGHIEAVIFDEVHKVKNGESKQGKAIQRINPPIKLALTGTPIMNRAEDLWNILTWLEAVKVNFYQFRARYCIMGGFKNKQVVAYKNLDELALKLQGVMLRRKKEEVLDLPDKIRTVEYVELTAKQEIIYNQIKAGILERLDEIELLPNPLSALLRLRQCTGGLEVLELEDKDNPKLDRIKELLEEEIIPNGHKAVIFTQWTKVSRILKRELRKYNPAYITGEVKNEERDAEVRKFQEDSRCKILIGTIGACGTGLTLTAGSYVIFTDKAWTPADNEQAEDRCIAEGQPIYVRDRGLISIEEVEEGDFVLTHTGKFKKVLNVKKRLNTGLMTKVSYKRFNIPLECTFDHKILIQRNGSSVTEWVKAHEILPGDFILMPTDLKVEDMEVLNIPDEVVNSDTFTNNWGVEQQIGKLRHIPREVELSNDIMYLFGYYLADGFVKFPEGGGKALVLAGNVTTKYDILERLKNVIEHNFGVGSSIYTNSTDKGAELCSYSVELARLFKWLFNTGTFDKKIPEFIMNLPPDKLEHLLGGYIDGDGYRRNKQVEYSTVNKFLAYQMLLIIIKCGKIPTLRKITKGEELGHSTCYVGGYTENGSPSNKDLLKRDDTFIYNLVSKIETYKSRKNVYDLTVEDDHTFVVGQCVVHNCYRIGTKGTVTVISLVAKDTIDEKIEKILENKKDIFNQVVEGKAVKRSAKQVLRDLLE